MFKMSKPQKSRLKTQPFNKANRMAVDNMGVDVSIIGAGLSGLIAAQHLQSAGKSVAVLDKGRSVGGRLATRRIANGIADHGAQFFTVRTAEFQQQVDLWLEKDLIYIWGYGWSDGSIKRTKSDGHPRYVTRGGMNALAKDLASTLTNVHVNTKVTAINWENNHWLIGDANNLTVKSDILVLTPPVPQSLALLEAIPLADTDKQKLERIQYGPCLCGLFVIDGDVDLPEPGALQDFHRQIYWIADNKAKGISPDERILTVHVDVGYSRNHYDDDADDVLRFMREELRKYLGNNASIKHEQLKKWRYSIPLTTHPNDFLKAEGLPLIFAGDAFGGRGRVEGAYLSGVAASKVALELSN